MAGYTDPMLEIEPANPHSDELPAPGQGDTYAMPATQGQVRFWSLDQLNPGNPRLTCR